MSEPGWTIRGYQAGDERALVELFARAFGKSISEAHWLWKLKQHTALVENVWLALDGDKTVFHYGGVPARFKIGAEEKPGMVSVDAMTDPDYRRRGLLTQVGQRAFDHWRESGMVFTLGLPNEQWRSRTQALGWQPLFPLQWLVSVLRPATLLARRLHLPFVSRWSVLNSVWQRYLKLRIRGDANTKVCEVKQADKRFDVLWQACSGNYYVSIVRDRAWVNWRYCAAPEVEYRVLLAERDAQPMGYVVFRVETNGARKVGAIADLLARDSITRSTLIDAVVDVLHKDEVEVISTLAVPRTELHEAFRRAGFVGRAAFGVNLIPFAANLPLEKLRDARNWGMAGGDFDVI